ncbi:MAG: hypothetical protein ABSG22_10665 [Sedimentisphaerales bacterium]|jgi:hypothetical protein
MKTGTNRQNPAADVVYGTTFRQVSLGELCEISGINEQRLYELTHGEDGWYWRCFLLGFAALKKGQFDKIIEEDEDI